MRWVFYSLLILNLVYLVWNLVEWSTPAVQPVQQRTNDNSAPRKLTLLEEARAGDSRSGQGERQSASGKPRKRLCPVIGPWENGDQARQALKTLEEAGYSGQVRSLEVKKKRLHWVYLPPFGSREKALKTLRELQSRGVDSFIVTEGADRNAISLGYFKNEESAQGLRSKMKTAGYPAQIRNTAQMVTEYWVYLDGRSIDDKRRALRAFIADHEGLELDHGSCSAPETRERPSL